MIDQTTSFAFAIIVATMLCTSKSNRETPKRRKTSYESAEILPVGLSIEISDRPNIRALCTEHSKNNTKLNVIRKITSGSKLFIREYEHVIHYSYFQTSLSCRE